MGNETAQPLPVLTADGMKVRFKQRCAETGDRHQNWQIRVHRALSWLKRAGEFADAQDEARFLFTWIALNSLYSRWDNQRNMPHIDTHARNDFLRRVCDWAPDLFLSAVRQHRGAVKKLLENPYLAADFWRNPDDPKARGRATQDANYLDKHLKDHDACRVLSQAMDRLFVFRGQLVHGASSGGSRLNRTTLRHGLLALEAFVPLIVHLTIEHGCGDDWPELCYPPLKQ